MNGLIFDFLSLLYVIIAIFYVIPYIMQKRDSDCTVVPSAFESGYSKYSKTSCRCHTTTWKKPSFIQQFKLMQPNKLSSLGFNYDEYYKPLSTGPKNIIEPETKWTTGDPTLVDYMNTVFIPMQRRDMKNATDRLIYQKRANAGFANQIAGVCDVLLLGIVYNRIVQINTPSLPNHFFKFPLYNFTYPTEIPFESEESRFSLLTDISNEQLTLVEYLPRSGISGITDRAPFNTIYPNDLVIESSTTMLKVMFKQPPVRQKMRHIIPEAANATIIRDNWYYNCFYSVFQPSELTLSFIEPWLQLFKNKFVVGIHARLAGNFTSWKEKAEHLSMDRIRDQYDAIDSILKEHSNSLLFLSTDNKNIESEISERFGKQVVFVGNLPRMHTGRFTNEAGVMRSFTELYLLGQCDVLYLTQRSMYSRMASYIKKKGVSVNYF